MFLNEISDILKKRLVKEQCKFFTLLIGAEGTKTPVGVWFRGDPAGASAEDSPKHPRTARAWSGNQQTSLTKP
ncbi:hypothetical protein QE429_003087 [Bacillus sp. SORGH_AS 510]|nr:hypothetical protein [Bacillus sp. SORGH_AS_0510]